MATAAGAAGEGRATPRERILLAAVRLLAAGGRDAVTTRAIMAAAEVQAPTIYRQFGDLHGLLVEAASVGFASYLSEKAAQQPSADPVQDLRAGWDDHVAFGLSQPTVYALLYGDPRQGQRAAAVGQARTMLRAIVQRVAETGRLRVAMDSAVEMVDAAGAGVVLHLLQSAPAARDSGLSAAVREAVLAAITTGAEETQVPAAGGRERTAARAIALKAALPNPDADWTAAELLLLGEWLERLS